MSDPVDVRSIFTRKALVPFWVVQMFIIGLQLALNGLRVMNLAWVKRTDTYKDGTDDYRSRVNVSLAITAVTLTIACIFFIMLVVQIVQYCRRRLTPGAYFGMNLVMFLIQTLSFILAIVSVVQHSAGGLVTVLIILFVWLSFLGSFIYSVIVFRRNRKGRFNNPKYQGLQ